MASNSGAVESRTPSAPPTVVMTPHAKERLEQWGVSMSAVLQALSSEAPKINPKTGSELFRVGDLRFVVKREGDRITVLTAAHPSDFSE